MLIKISLLILLLYCFAGMALYIFQERILYPGAFWEIPSPAFIPHEIKKVTFQTEDKLDLEGYAKTHGENSTLVLYFGGNFQHAVSAFDLLSSAHYDVLSVNYRGYGESQGFPSETFLSSDALSVYDSVASSYQKIILVGFSLGSAVAVYLASQRKVDRLVLLAPFDSALSVAKSRYFFLPVSWLIRHRFQSDSWITHVKAPVDIVYAERDRIIPHTHTQALWAAVPNPSSLLLIEDVGHNTMLDAPVLIERIEEVIAGTLAQEN